MTTRILIVALGVAWVAALAGVVWLMSVAGMRPHDAPWLLTNMDFVLQACAVLSIVSAVIGIRAGARRRAVAGVAAAFGWGVLGAVLGAVNARFVLICTHPPYPLSAYAPAYAEGLIVLLVGLTGALIGLALLSRRRA